MEGSRTRLEVMGPRGHTSSSRLGDLPKVEEKESAQEKRNSDMFPCHCVSHKPTLETSAHAPGLESFLEGDTLSPEESGSKRENEATL